MPKKDVMDFGTPNIGHDDTLTNWDIVHSDRFFSGFSHIPKQRWDAIRWEKPSGKSVRRHTGQR